MNFSNRRSMLRASAPAGKILILSASFVPRNYPAEIYPFHQDATFRYFTGLNIPDAALVIDETGKETLFLTIPDPDDVIWTGKVPTPEELAASAGIANYDDYSKLSEVVDRNTLFITPYDWQLKTRLAQWLHVGVSELSSLASRELGQAIIALRSIKDDEEIEEIEYAIAVTKEMLALGQKAILPGVKEADVLAPMMSKVVQTECDLSFNPIVTVHGEILHNQSYDHVIEKDSTIVIDIGAESPRGYCADITRTYSAAGKFSDRKLFLYNAVLKAQLSGIEKTKSVGVSMFDVHMEACRTLTRELQSIGLMKGDIEESLAAGAHALFMPHGIGHMLGMDAHDMENYGDDVGYAPGTKRSTQFGLNALRLHKKLEPGFVITVEPGCYFIPELIDRWSAQKHLDAFICYDELEKYRDFRGIRIEDDVLITPTGSRVLGTAIPK